MGLGAEEGRGLMANSIYMIEDSGFAIFIRRGGGFRARRSIHCPCRRVAREKKKRRPAMAGFEELKRFQQGQRGRAALFPFLRNRRVSFRVNASLRTASFAESVMDLGDRCPVPVLEKVGSAL